VRINISGCTNSCGQHHAPTSASSAPSAGPTAVAPGYQMLLGGYVGEEQIHFGEKALRLPGQGAPRRGAGVRRFAEERQAGETFRGWLDRSGGAGAVGATLKDLDVFPTPEEAPTSTSTTARPAPTSPRSASECAT
jgi:sulfite reductase (ferredoxin)